VWGPLHGDKRTWDGGRGNVLKGEREHGEEWARGFYGVMQKFRLWRCELKGIDEKGSLTKKKNQDRRGSILKSIGVICRCTKEKPTRNSSGQQHTSKRAGGGERRYFLK